MSLMSVKETAKYIGVAEVTLRRYIKAETIPFIKVGGLYKFDVEEIKNWLKAGK